MKYLSLIVFVVVFSSCKGEIKSGNKVAKDQPAYARFFNKEWANNEFWNDGKAEVAVYQAQRKIYNKVRDFEYTYITVSEEFNKEYRVKTDDYSRKDLYKVMKLNAFAAIPTDNYPYHYLTSFFFLRSQPWLVDKITNSSQEWCGNTFKEYLANTKGYQYRYQSYFDGDGDGEKQLESKILFEDQLSYTLRSLNFKAGLSFEAKVLESQIATKVGKMTIYNSSFLVEDGANEIAGEQSWKVTLKLDVNKQNTYYIGKVYPNVVFKQQTWDGRNLQLKKISRYAYWQN